MYDTTGGDFMTKGMVQFFTYRALRVAVPDVFLVTLSKPSHRFMFSTPWLSSEWFI